MQRAGLHLSLHHLTVMDATPAGLIDAAAGAGIDRVCLFVRAPSRRLDIFPLVADAQTRRSVAERLAATGVRVHNVEVFSLTPRTEVAELRAALEMGAALGAARATALVNDAEPGRAADSFAAFCRLAAELELRVGLEFMPFSVLNTMEQAIDLLTRAAQPNADLAVDVLHLHRTGGSVAALAPYRGLIGYAQLCDAPLQRPAAEWPDEAIADRMLPGKGDLPLRAFLDALPACVVDLEVPSRGLREAGAGPAIRARLAAEAARSLMAVAPEEPPISPAASAPARCGSGHRPPPGHGH